MYNSLIYLDLIGKLLKSLDNENLSNELKRINHIINLDEKYSDVVPNYDIQYDIQNTRLKLFFSLN